MQILIFFGFANLSLHFLNKKYNIQARILYARSRLLIVELSVRIWSAVLVK